MLLAQSLEKMSYSEDKLPAQLSSQIFGCQSTFWIKFQSLSGMLLRVLNRNELIYPQWVKPVQLHHFLSWFCKSTVEIQCLSELFVQSSWCIWLRKNCRYVVCPSQVYHTCMVTWQHTFIYSCIHVKALIFADNCDALCFLGCGIVRLMFLRQRANTPERQQDPDLEAN